MDQIDRKAVEQAVVALTKKEGCTDVKLRESEVLCELAVVALDEAVPDEVRPRLLKLILKSIFDTTEDVRIRAARDYFGGEWCERPYSEVYHAATNADGVNSEKKSALIGDEMHRRRLLRNRGVRQELVGITLGISGRQVRKEEKQGKGVLYVLATALMRFCEDSGAISALIRSDESGKKTPIQNKTKLDVGHKHFHIYDALITLVLVFVLFAVYVFDSEGIATISDKQISGLVYESGDTPAILPGEVTDGFTWPVGEYFGTNIESNLAPQEYSSEYQRMEAVIKVLWIEADADCKPEAWGHWSLESGERHLASGHLGFGFDESVYDDMWPSIVEISIELPRDVATIKFEARASTYIECDNWLVNIRLIDIRIYG